MFSQLETYSNLLDVKTSEACNPIRQKTLLTIVIPKVYSGSTHAYIVFPFLKQHISLNGEENANLQKKIHDATTKAKHTSTFYFCPDQPPDSSYSETYFSVIRIKGMTKDDLLLMSPAVSIELKNNTANGIAPVRKTWENVPILIRVSPTTGTAEKFLVALKTLKSYFVNPTCNNFWIDQSHVNLVVMEGFPYNMCMDSSEQIKYIHSSNEKCNSSILKLPHYQTTISSDTDNSEIWPERCIVPEFKNTDRVFDVKSNKKYTVDISDDVKKQLSILVDIMEEKIT